MVLNEEEGYLLVYDRSVRVSLARKLIKQVK